MKRRVSQSVLEYIVIFALVIMGLISVGFIPQIKSIFTDHFNECVEEMLK